MSSVLQPWVEELPLREQGTLLTCVRNCDVSVKETDRCGVDRQLVAWLRWCFLNPADPREVDYAPCSWFQSTPPEFKQSLLGHFPLHWYSHVMHACEVVSVRHPDVNTRRMALNIYDKLVHGLHLEVERPVDMIARLAEDRIAAGTVIS